MTTMEPTEVVGAFMDAFIAMDFDRALEHVSADCEYTNVPLGSVSGHAGIRQVLEPFFAAIHEDGAS